VDAPKVDKDATKESLDKDVKYQAAKLANNASDGMLNSMFSGMDFGGGQSPVNQDIGDHDEDYEDEAPDGRGLADPNLMSDPEEELDLFNEEVMDFGGGCGEECGCTCEAACCCLPPDYFNNVGDFLLPIQILCGLSSIFNTFYMFS